ncbi:uncharacterized protein C8A04DRAFT_37587 [Dichotomopilus funicola]|uniref:Peptidase S54 rhomboid domain-containing protein n=1 Tax=Dichotomopilus funicola TaxID=1934379 RepID=A0AAN6ZL27_9PEZI|nr:hypothetical protein C8A04DRAFT_37587 [Dichotomopilus funicola]
MNGCALGINALRTGVQAVAQRFASPCSQIYRPAAVGISNRSYSSSRSWPSQRHSPLPQRGIGGERHTGNTTAGPALLQRARPILPQWLGIRTLIGDPATITHYVDLPPNYTDEGGLPFAKKDLTAPEVVAIFGPSMSTSAGNALLRILHGRRVAGTLDDPMLRVNTMMFSKKTQETALAYLRKHIPVDEVVNAGLRAEDELAALENGGELVATTDNKTKEDGKEVGAAGYASKFKIYKEAPEDDGTSTAKKPSVYGYGALDALRARNKAKWDARMKYIEEERKKMAEEEANRYGGEQKAGPLQVVNGERPTRALSPAMQEYMRRATSDIKEIPTMTATQRIVPSLLFVLGILGLCFAYSAVYTPAKRENRLFPDIPPAAATVGLIVLANLAGWVLWKIPPLWKHMNAFFIIVPGLPRPVSLLGAMFSHQRGGHLFQNMLVLWFMGVRYHDDVGRGDFLATYFASGALGGLATLVVATVTGRLGMSSLGASGATYGIAAAYLWLHRFDTFRILGLPPPPEEGFVSGLVLLALVVAHNLGGFFTSSFLKVDITSHLVGILAGVAAASLVQMKKEAGLPAGAERRSRIAVRRWWS